MKCPICKHGSTHKGYASITLERDGTTLFFKNVPADICDNCGEIYHDEKVVPYCPRIRGGTAYWASQGNRNNPSLAPLTCFNLI